MNRKTGQKYSKNHLLNAVQAVKDGSSQFAAAKKYGIPRSTLFNKVWGKSEIDGKSGPGRVLSMEEEKCIEKWVLCLTDRGFPVVKRQLLHSIQMYLNANKRHTVFPDNYPGEKWYKNYLKRHPIIAKRMSQNLIKSRAAVTEEHLTAWHAEVRKYFEDKHLLEALEDPKRVFNVDEKGFVMTPKNEVVLARRGQKAVYNRSQNDEKECVTALLGGNAAGMQTPPMLVYPYKRMPSNILLNLPATWSVGISDNGWQTQQTFYDYISNVFCKWLSQAEIKLPIILFIDGHKSHMSLTLSDFCSSHQIELVALYPNATHIIQPMDVVVFKPLSGSWDIQVKDWKIAHNFNKIDKKDIAPILKKSIEAIDCAGLLQKGFERCGLFPFIVDNINMSRLVHAVTDNSSDQFFIDEDATKPKLQKSKEETLSQLKTLEELIDPTFLNMFRSTNKEWGGPIEYKALYSIWKKLYADASAFFPSDDQGTMEIDVESVDTETPALYKSETNDTTFFFVGENGELIKSDDTDCIVIENRIVVSDYVNFGAGDVVYLDADKRNVEEFSAEADEPMSIEEINREKQSIGDQTENLNIENHPISMQLDDPQKLVFDEPNVSENLTPLISKPFQKKVFKKAFVMPQVNSNKKKKFAHKEKPSTVIISEAWKENERKKLEEKKQIAAEVAARKLEREQKKVMAVQVKANNALAREKKKIENAAKEANKKLKKMAKKSST